MSVIQDELAGFLRAWRERLRPTDAGLPASNSRRRARGLRREEVAHLAGVSVDYLARLEQGRAQSPSPSVLASLSRALRLTSEERTHLFRLAGQAEPGPGTIDRHITPSLQRLLDRLADVPVLVVDAAGEIVAANRLAAALIGHIPDGSWRERSIPWRHFTGAPSRIVRSDEEQAANEAAMVGELREALGRFPNDEHLRALISELLANSPAFARLWEQRPVARRPARRKTFRHPEVGLITLDCDALDLQGSDLSVIVYTAAPGSAGAEALALIDAIGLQTFSD